MTGNRASAVLAGVQTFTVRQSSLVSPSAPGWGQAGPKASKARGSDQGTGGWGGRQRRGPTGGAA